MTSTTFFFIFIPLLAFILLAINLIFAPHNPYQEKDSAFECGFHSFLGQNRTQFSISFFIFALLFLLFDLEILLVYPYIVSAYANGIYGLIVMLIFFLVLTLGFAFELGKNALKIDSRQMYSVWNKVTIIISFTSEKNILNLSSLSYLDVFKLACRTFISNLSSKDIALNIAIRIIFGGIIYFLVMYFNTSVLELALVRFFILQIILLFVFYLYEKKIVFFLHNCTIKDLIYITTYSVIFFTVMLAFFSIFINVSNHIELAIVFIIPDWDDSRVLMNISELLNPTTPPASPGNNAGSSGTGGPGGGNGGNGGNSGLHPLPGHSTNHSNDSNSQNNGQSVPASTYPFYNPYGGNQPHASNIADILDHARVHLNRNSLSRPMLSSNDHILLEGFIRHTKPFLYSFVYANTHHNNPYYSELKINTILTQALRKAP